MIEPEIQPQGDSSASDPPPAAAPPPPPQSRVPSLDELGALVQEVSDVARAVARLALAETALSALALRRVVQLRILVLVSIALGLVFLGAAGVIALANWLGSMAAACTIVGALFVVLSVIAAERAKAWRKRIGYAETRAVLREGLQRGPDDAT